MISHHTDPQKNLNLNATENWPYKAILAAQYAEPTIHWISVEKTTVYYHHKIGDAEIPKGVFGDLFDWL